MFNSITSLLISFMLLSACNNSTDTKEPVATKDNLQTSSDTTPVTQPVTTDEHGCKTADGERWSIVRNSCIFLTKSGIKMEPVDPSLDKTTLAWLVFSDDEIRVEIFFLRTQEKTVIIRKSSAAGEPDKWANGTLTITKVSGIYRLNDEGKILYQSTGNIN